MSFGGDGIDGPCGSRQQASPVVLPLVDALQWKLDRSSRLGPAGEAPRSSARLASSDFHAFCAPDHRCRPFTTSGPRLFAGLLFWLTSYCQSRAASRRCPWIKNRVNHRRVSDDLRR